MKTAVIDANIGLSYALPLPYSKRALALLQQWRFENVNIAVPSLWNYEILSGLRKAIAHRLISQKNAIDAIQGIKDLAFFEVSHSDDCEMILQWADRLNQIVAYDAVYLALSEQLGAEFWTADKRLANAAKQSGADWVHYLQSDSS
jgi:predicted nucleic acid-binding protein